MFLRTFAVGFALAISMASAQAATTYYIYQCIVKNKQGEYQYHQLSNIITAEYNNTNGMHQKAKNWVRQVEPAKSEGPITLRVEDPNVSCVPYRMKSMAEVDDLVRQLKGQQFIREGTYKIVSGASEKDAYFYNATGEIPLAPKLQ